MDIPFLKKLRLPGFSLDFLRGKPSRTVGIDVGIHSAKVIQLRYEKERAILETYGELLSARYLKTSEGGQGGFLRYADADITELLKDVLRESNVTARDAVIGVPATSSFVTPIPFPKISVKEIAQALPFEARKYVPIPIAEVALDWEVIDETDQGVTVLLVAVPKEVIEKFKRISSALGLSLAALEVETFSMVRALVGTDTTPTLVLNMGHFTTTVAVVDHGKLRMSHNISRGSEELTRALAQGMGINLERAETIKHDTGIEERVEQKEITSVVTPLLDSLLAEIERIVALYNRRTDRKIQKINLTGGGSNMKGLIDYTSTRFGIEVTRGNPFARVVAPAFLQPMLRDIGPNFSTAVGLALHEITSR